MAPSCVLGCQADEENYVVLAGRIYTRHKTHSGPALGGLGALDSLSALSSSSIFAYIGRGGKIAEV